MLNEQINAILVDDERSARTVLANLLGKYSQHINLCAQCSNVPDAVDAIKKHHPQVVFLDIEMPQYSGYELVDFFDEINFEIIFITAYDKYALKAFEVSAIDYILKPIDPNRFNLTINRLLETVVQKTTLQQFNLLTNTLQDETVEQIVVTEKGYKHIVNVNDIVFIQAQEAYSIIVLQNNKQHLSSKKLKYYEHLMLNNKQFFRTHKSWFINLNHILSYSKTQLEIKLSNGQIAKLSRYKKAEFESMFQ